MASCKHGERLYREGRSAKGPWKAYFCPTRKGDPDQCPPEFLKTNRSQASEKFNEDLDRSDFVKREEKRSDTITRLALVKSAFERGSQWNSDLQEELEEAERWVTGV